MAKTIKEYFRNPMGKGSAVLKKSSTSGYDSEYEELKRLYSISVYNVRRDYYILVKVPSSVNKYAGTSLVSTPVYYDVLFAIRRLPKHGDIGDVPMRVFSNSPSFIYTYANAFNRQGMCISDLLRAISPEAYKNKAKYRNPYGVVGYEKSIYLAVKYIMDRGFNQASALAGNAVARGTSTAVYGTVQRFGKVMKARELADARIRAHEAKRREKDKKKAKDIGRDNRPPVNTSKRDKPTGVTTVDKTANVKKVNKRKKISTAKRRKSN